MDTDGTASVQRRLASLPSELRWRICNDVLFGQPDVPNMDDLLLHPLTRPGHDAIVRQLQLQAIFRQRRMSFDRLQIEERWSRAIRLADARRLKELLSEEQNAPSEQLLTSLRHAMSQTVFFVPGSAPFMLAGLDVLDRYACATRSSHEEADLFGRLIEYCVNEEEIELLHSCTWWLIVRSAVGLLSQKMRPVRELEQRARSRLFEWSNVQRLPHYMHVLDTHTAQQSWSRALVHDMPITTAILTAWILIEVWNKHVAIAALKIVAVTLATIIARRVHAQLRRKAVRWAFDLIHDARHDSLFSVGWTYVCEQTTLAKKALQQAFVASDVQRPAPADLAGNVRRANPANAALGAVVSGSTAARRPMRRWWFNEVMVRNASRNEIIVEAYNAADHYFLTHPFSTTSIAPRHVALVRSAWDLRGTRIVVVRARNARQEHSAGKDAGDSPPRESWRRGSTFNLYSKPCLLVSKNGTITIIDGDFVTPRTWASK